MCRGDLVWLSYVLVTDHAKGEKFCFSFFFFVLFYFRRNSNKAQEFFMEISVAASKKDKMELYQGQITQRYFNI